MITCKGCGIKLQVNDPLLPGYQVDLNHDYCQRCYRLRHYGEIAHTLALDFNYQTIANQINQSDSLLVWIVDLLDIESSMISGINRIFNYQKIIMIGTKQDLLPKSLNEKKIINFLKQRLAAFDIKIADLILVGKNTNLNYILDFIKRNLISKQVAFIGQANAGKSTLINRLLNQANLTVSPYPGTTLDMISIDYPEFTIYDSPGFSNSSNYLWYIRPEDIKYVTIKVPLKPKIYQIYQPQSFTIANLVKLDVIPQDRASLIFYFSESLKIHRGKLTGLNDAEIVDHYQQLKTKDLKIKKKRINLIEPPFDIVVKGLGWIKVTKPLQEVIIYVAEAVEVVVRKALI